ncbi:hypothetical protein BA766_21335 [Stenotrophomonas maltophilia]|nr:hypothetical protein BA766_21335 [Stenotrophomonas maltophilia]
MTWAIVVAAHVTAFLGGGFAELLPQPQQARAIFSVLILASVPAHLVVPILGGAIYTMQHSALPK